MSSADATPRTTMPAAFLGHGSPMNALENNRYTESWRAFGAAVPVPRAILMISAHWYIKGSAVTAMGAPKTIHDFYGFPKELFAVQYGAPGDPLVAAEVAEVVKPAVVDLDAESWGIDHGAWSVLCHAFPAADIPVVQLSIDATQPFDFHFDLGAKLAPLRDDGVLIVGSGNVVHNLGLLDWAHPEAGFDWAHRFDEDALALMTTRPEDVPGLRDHVDYALASPTPDHLIPLFYLAGLAAASGTDPTVIVDGYAMGSLSMTSYGLGVAPSV